MVGLTFVDIGKRMGISHVRAQQLVAAAMKRREASYADTLENVRKMELARLDHMFATHFTRQATSPEAAHLCLKIMERRTQYLGLDAPVESRVAVVAPREDKEYDLSKLTTEELRQFRTLALKMGTKSLPPPEPESPPAVDAEFTETKPEGAA